MQPNSPSAQLVVNGLSLGGFNFASPIPVAPSSGFSVQLSGGSAQPYALAIGQQLEPGVPVNPWGIVNIDFLAPGFSVLTTGVLDGAGQSSLFVPSSGLPIGLEVTAQALVGVTGPSGFQLSGPSTFRAVPGDPGLPIPTRWYGTGLSAWGRHTVAADFDGDGFDDYAMTAGILMSTGSTTGPPLAFVSLDPPGTEVLAGDFDQDGNVDLVVQNNCVGAPQLEVYRGDGSGVFYGFAGQPPLHAPAFQAPFQSHDDGAFAVADLNGDMRLDVVAANGWYTSAGDNIVLLENISTGPGVIAFAVHRLNQNTASTSRALALLDINGDGLKDVILDRNGANEVLLNPGTVGGFATVSPMPLSVTGLPEPGSRWLSAADVDNDGMMDLLWVGESNRGVLFANGTGPFSYVPIAHTPPPTNTLSLTYFVPCGNLPTRGPEPRMDAMDFDLDGRLDVVFVDPSQQGSPWVVIAWQPTPRTFPALWYLPIQASTPPGLGIGMRVGHAIPMNADGTGGMDLVVGGDNATVLTR